MKIPRFHQFVHVEKGLNNSLLIDFLNKNIYQVDNKTIESFLNSHLAAIGPFISFAYSEKLIIDIDEARWIPYIDVKNPEISEASIGVTLEIENGVSKDAVFRLCEHFAISKIVDYGKSNLDREIPCMFSHRDLDIGECDLKNRVNPRITYVTESQYFFNSRFNPCWGKRLALTAAQEIKPCIYSDIVIGNLSDMTIDIIEEKSKEYWRITKDKIAKCKSCEMRYICFDCRELARRVGNGNLYHEDPYCKYDPCKWPARV